MDVDVLLIDELVVVVEDANVEDEDVDVVEVEEDVDVEFEQVGRLLEVEVLFEQEVVVVVIEEVESGEVGNSSNSNEVFCSEIGTRRFHGPHEAGCWIETGTGGGNNDIVEFTSLIKFGEIREEFWFDRWWLWCFGIGNFAIIFFLLCNFSKYQSR